MRRKFTFDDFEHSLKEHADEFKMMPSKRVWYGIYNDIHPGRRWPSVAVALLLMFTLVIVGHLNTHNGVHAVSRYSKSITRKTEGTTNNLVSNINVKNEKKKVLLENETIANKQFAATNEASKTFSDSSSTSNSNGIASPVQMLPGDDVTNKSVADINTSLQKNNFVQNKKADAGIEKGNDMLSLNYRSNFGDDDISTNIISAPNQPEFSQLIVDKTAIAPGENNAKPDKLGPISSSLAVKKSQLVSHKKSNPDISWTYFAEPVISNVIFKGKSIVSNPGVSNISPTFGANVTDNKVIHSPAFGLEAGLQLNYQVSGKLKFISGFEITYSGYRISSNEVHPTFATLTLKDKNSNVDYSRSYVTHYGNGIGEAMVTLRNYSWQASLPIGLQYQIAGNDKIQFNTTVNFEPSFILKSNAFLLSTEGANYVNDPTLLRKLNASSNIGAFISFSVGKLKWQVGPNVRYQWLSTYKTDYTIKEHLIDYGIRIAITK